MVKPVYLAFDEYGCIAVFVLQTDCKAFCESGDYTMKVVDIEDVHEYLY